MIMADQKQYNHEEVERFSADMARRFEEFTRWAIEAWPNRGFPLLGSDFDTARGEMRAIMAEKLRQGASLPPDKNPDDDDPPIQYRNVNPSPWP
jgi:hypothetical protein